jgi:hypothetical protein
MISYLRFQRKRCSYLRKGEQSETVKWTWILTSLGVDNERIVRRRMINNCRTIPDHGDSNIARSKRDLQFMYARTDLKGLRGTTAC